MRISKKIEIVEVAPRDGLQNENAPVSTADKLELVRRAAQAGARRIEVVSFVSPAAVPQMADADVLMQMIHEDIALQDRGLRISGLVLNRRGVERAVRAAVDEINFVVLASETFNRRNQRATISETLGELAAAASLAREAGIAVCATIGASFGCPFEGEVAASKVREIAMASAHAGVCEISLADTIGVADPLSVEQLFLQLKSDLPRVVLRAHFHNTRNTGIANVYAAWCAGVTVFDASIGGIGGCPFAPGATGNIATEDLVYMLARMGAETDIDLELLRSASRWLQDDILQKPVASALLRAGGFPQG